MAQFIFFSFNTESSVSFFSILFLFGVSIRFSKSYTGSIGAPVVAPNAILFICNGKSFSAFDGDQV
jgi:hypothetical protein